ncbi:MarR family transcriptional regulator [uncultured Brevundimonas sp.]|uniref:MarR family winged helix-turn-helix transcriptional regulator n=1 Tax=uncultured Brevundimonas sp. TaxID=213418 RepID=UPI0025D10F9A|nr:MarR family transcriptional regulator [uncultured Brevundimonas sp.]
MPIPSDPADLDDAFYLNVSETDVATTGIDPRASLELVVSMRIAFVARAWITRANALFRGRGYTAAQRAHLYVLASKPKGLTQSELAAILRISEASLSRRIKLSIEEGLVSRHPLSGDGRANLIRLESKGLDALNTSDRLAREDRTRLLAGVTKEELAITAKVLKLLTDRVPQTPERSDA